MRQNSSIRIQDHIILKVLPHKFKCIFTLKSDKIEMTFNCQKIVLLVKIIFLIVKSPSDIDIIPRDF